MLKKILTNKFFIAILLITGLVYILLNMMPESIDMDLEKIGIGKPSVVFVYDPNLANSKDQALELKKARQSLGDAITFLIVNTGSPKTEDFKRRYNAQSLDLLFFDSDGKLVNRKIATINAGELVRIISDIK